MKHLSDRAKEDIRAQRLTLRAYGELYGVHHTTILRVLQPREHTGHAAGYHRDYYQRHRTERCRYQRERRERRYWALWLLRECLGVERFQAYLHRRGISGGERCGGLWGAPGARRASFLG